jgi:hypothetical protein
MRDLSHLFSIRQRSLVSGINTVILRRGVVRLELIMLVDCHTFRLHSRRSLGDLRYRLIKLGVLGFNQAQVLSLSQTRYNRFEVCNGLVLDRGVELIAEILRSKPGLSRCVRRFDVELLKLLLYRLHLHIERLVM